MNESFSGPILRMAEVVAGASAVLSVGALGFTVAEAISPQITAPLERTIDQTLEQGIPTEWLDAHQQRYIERATAKGPAYYEMVDYGAATATFIVFGAACRIRRRETDF